MPKPRSESVESEPDPTPDTDQMAADTLMTSAFSGLGLVAATIVLAVCGTLFLNLSRALSDSAARLGFGVGLAVGMAGIAWLLRHFADRIRARSTNLYRGAWIGSVAALVIIALMAFAPQVAFPQYCPPGAICESTGTR